METEFIGKKLRNINYNDLTYSGLSVYQDGKEVAWGTIGQVLKQIPHLADEVVKDANMYFETLVLRV